MALTSGARSAAERVEAALLGLGVAAMLFSGWHVFRFWNSLAYDSTDHKIEPFGEGSALAVICLLIICTIVGCVALLRSVSNHRIVSRLARWSYAVLVLYGSWRLYRWAAWYFMVSHNL
ncbi:MAG TPA: hypothetical protein VLE22_12685 [Bryobacteraceae bacterium]|nr:hypothetical protein [Bryobacteraceae bacterium]